MLDQNSAIILAAIIGALATLLGGLVGGVAVPFLTQKLSIKAENRKKHHEKIEIAYTLLDQIKGWIDYQIDDLWCFQVQKNRPNKPDNLECPINTLVLLVNLFAPSLEKSVKELNESVETLKKMRYDIQHVPLLNANIVLDDTLLQVAYKQAEESYKE